MSQLPDWNPLENLYKTINCLTALRWLFFITVMTMQRLLKCPSDDKVNFLQLDPLPIMGLFEEINNKLQNVGEHCPESIVLHSLNWHHRRMKGDCNHDYLSVDLCSQMTRMQRLPWLQKKNDLPREIDVK